MGKIFDDREGDTTFDPNDPAHSGFTLNPGNSSPGSVQAPAGGVPLSSVMPGGGGGGGGYVPSFNWAPPPAPNGRPDYGPVPVFTPPQFAVPSYEDAVNSPGFQFRLHQGNEALNASAAAKGMLRTGGTLKAIEDYGQNAASQEYQNVFDRDVNAFKLKYQGALDAFAPRMAQYQANVGGGNLQYNNAYNAWQFAITEERMREQMLLDAQSRALGYLG